MPRVPAWFWFWFWFWVLMNCASVALENIPAEVGQDVTLPCRVLINNKPITAVEWNRPELDPEYVLLYRDGRVNPKYQHSSYENRVDLQDREMKDGDVSLILKNVKMEDTGTYECLVFQRETNHRKRSSSMIKPISIIYLDVLPSGGEAGGRKDGGGKDGGDMDGNSRGHLGVVGVIPLLLVVASVGVLIYRRQMRQRSHLHVPPDEAADEQMF